MRRHRRPIAAIAATLLTFALGVNVASADTLPSVSADPASKVGVTSALLTGKVDPNGASGDGITSWRFQYRPAGAEEWWEAGEGALEEAASQEGNEVEVEAILTNLTPGQSYELRLLAFNAAGQAETSPQGFTMDAATVPTVVTKPTQTIGYTIATLEGSVDPEGGNVNEIGDEVLPIEWQLWYSIEGEGGEPEGWSFGDAGTIEGEDARSTDPIDDDVEAELAPGSLIPGEKYLVQLRAYYTPPFWPEVSTGAPHESFETDAAPAPVVTIDPVSAITATSASLSGAVNPNAPKAASELEGEDRETLDINATFATNWSFSCDPACGVGPEGGSLAADNVPGSAGDVATHLQPNTEYTVKLAATNLGGKGEASESGGEPVSFKTAAAAPTVETTGASSSSPGTAELNGWVNPHNSPTDYWFEWGTQDCAVDSCAAVPLGKDADVGSGGENVFVSRQLSGLKPGVVYHYRLLADNGVGSPVAGLDRTFVTAGIEPGCRNVGLPGSGFLPNCRAWEMVSPSNKNGGDVIPASDRVRAAADGSAIAFSSFVSFGESQGGSIAAEYLAQRDPGAGGSGWRTHGISPKQPSMPLTSAISSLESMYEGEMSPDLSRGIYRAHNQLTDYAVPAAATVSNLYVRQDLRAPGPGGYQPISLPFAQPPMVGVSPTKTYVASTSSDFSKVTFETRSRLTEDAVENGDVKLYESDQGVLRLAGRIPEAGGHECDDQAGPSCEASPSSRTGRGAERFRRTPHMVSADGSRVFFEAPAGADATAGTGSIYVREDGVRTLKLNVSENPTPDDPQGAELWDASVDGSRVFFTSRENLVAEDVNGGPDIYMYDLDAPVGDRLTLISADHEPAEVDSALGVVGASTDGRALYFTAFGQLVAGEVAGHNRNLYLWRDGVTSYVGSFEASADSEKNDLDAWMMLTSFAMKARVTPDGRHLLFGVSDSTGFEGRGGLPAIDQDGHWQYYLYSAESGRLRCATCNPAGPSIKDAEVNVRVSERVGALMRSVHMSNALSDDGRYVFFSTEEALTPEDTNGVADAYQYDAKVEEIRLLSSGTSPDGSYFLDASASGRDAFIATSERLSGWDKDDSYDLYDVRLEGGIADPVPLPADCEGDACRGPSSGQPAQEPRSSATLVGPGDPARVRGCPKGHRRVKRAGKVRCLKRVKARRGHNRTAKNNGRAAK